MILSYSKIDKKKTKNDSRKKKDEEKQEKEVIFLNSLNSSDEWSRADFILIIWGQEYIRGGGKEIKNERVSECVRTHPYSNFQENGFESPELKFFLFLFLFLFLFFRD